MSVYGDKNTPKEKQALERKSLEMNSAQSFKSVSIIRMRFVWATAHHVSLSNGALEESKGHVQG